MQRRRRDRGRTFPHRDREQNLQTFHSSQRTEHEVDMSLGRLEQRRHSMCRHTHYCCNVHARDRTDRSKRPSPSPLVREALRSPTSQPVTPKWGARHTHRGDWKPTQDMHARDQRRTSGNACVRMLLVLSSWQSKLMLLSRLASVPNTSITRSAVDGRDRGTRCPSRNLQYQRQQGEEGLGRWNALACMGAHVLRDLRNEYLCCCQRSGTRVR